MNTPPFRTKNTLLAFALLECGCEWLDPLKPCSNLYFADDLKKRGIDTCDQAIAKGIPGEVEYSFKRTETLNACLIAFDKEQDFLKTIENGQQVPNTYDIEPEEMARIVCRCLKTYGGFKTLWQKVPYSLYVRNEGPVRVKEKPNGGKTITGPGFRIVGQHATDATLKRLRLK